MSGMTKRMCWFTWRKNSFATNRLCTCSERQCLDTHIV